MGTRLEWESLVWFYMPLIASRFYNYKQVCSLHSRNYLCSLNSLCIDRKVPSTCDMHLPVAVVLLTDPGLSHMEAETADNCKTIQAR